MKILTKFFLLSFILSSKISLAASHSFLPIPNQHKNQSIFSEAKKGNITEVNKLIADGASLSSALYGAIEGKNSVLAPEITATSVETF